MLRLQSATMPYKDYKEYTLREEKYHKEKDRKSKERKATSGDQSQLAPDPYMYSAVQDPDKQVGGLSTMHGLQCPMFLLMLLSKLSQ